MATEIQIQSDSEAQTIMLAESIASQLQPGDLVALEGELGSGKTVFVRGLAQGLGLSPSSVSSPTFVICQEYAATDSTTPTLVHIDAYRLSGPDELETIGWTELLQSKDVIIAVEWPSRIQHALPSHRVNVTFEHTGARSRAIIISAPQELVDRLANVVNVREGDAQRSTSTKCRTCGKPLNRAASTFPFCSERCRLADLGTWFNEGYRVGRAMEADDELED